MISLEVRRQIDRGQRRVLASLEELLVAAKRGDRDELAKRATNLKQSLGVHLELVTYVLDAIADDDPASR